MRVQSKRFLQIPFHGRLAMAFPVSRRTFLQVSTAAAAASCVSHALPVSAAADKGTVAIDPPLSQFAYMT
jgi:hypothetical protein